MLKRLSCVAALAAVLTLGPAVSAGAAEGPEVFVEDIEFTISSDKCDRACRKGPRSTVRGPG